MRTAITTNSEQGLFICPKCDYKPRRATTLKSLKRAAYRHFKKTGHQPVIEYIRTFQIIRLRLLKK